ncbi:MAG: hypothetical protein A2X64_00630 [Ignavibacteria bacterium GWF2_33_9]|nr:MAG: hypothetical protein A2X64_00630 [Ignavibacteria bacterium GWF2_33_9]
MIIFIFTINSPISLSNWEMLKGPGYNNGIVSMDAYCNNILISIFSEVFLSTDAGENWKHINKDLDVYLNWASPLLLTENNIYIGSGHVIEFSSYGVYNSTNKGDSWEHTQLIFDKIIKIDSKIFAIANDSQGYMNNNIYQLNIEQNDWEKVFDSIPKAANILSFYEDSSKYYLGFNVTSKYTQDSSIKRTNIGIYDKKIKMWTFVCDSSCNIWKEHILCLNKKDSVLFAGTSYGIYSSIDYGQNWELVSNKLIASDTTYSFNYGVPKLLINNNYIYAICTSNTQSETFDYTNSSFLSYSTNNGNTWILDSLFSWNNPRELKLFENKLLIATKDGLYLSDFALTEKKDLMNENLVGDFVLDFNCNENVLYTATPYGSAGIHYSTNFGMTWELMENNLMNSTITKIEVKDNHLLAVVSYKYLYISENSGKTFSQITIDNGLFDTSVLSTKIFDNLVFVGTTSGLFFSEDWGKSWSYLTQNNPIKVYSIAIKDNQIILGSNNNVLLISNDYGQNWSKKLIPDEFLNIIYSISIEDNILIGTTHAPKDIYDQFIGRGLFISDDQGETFNRFESNLSDSIRIYSIIKYDGVMFLGSQELNSNNSKGVYYSTNNGLEWIPYSQGLTNRYLTKIEICGKYLFASTQLGMYRVPLNEFGIIGVKEIEVKSNYLWASTLYPNPAHDRVTAKIYWDMGLDIGTADIGIYNIYGNQVESDENIEIVQESDWSGKLTWNCSGVPVGTYFIKIDYGTATRVIKFVKI